MEETSQIPRVTSAPDLEAHLRSRDELFALFYASWCPYSRRFLPVFENHARDPGRFALVQDDGDTLSDPWAIEIFPTVLFFRKGAVARRLDGRRGAGLNEEELARFIRDCSAEQSESTGGPR